MHIYIQAQSKEKNIGLQIFRMILCFWVVLLHCLKKFNRILIKYIIEKKFHVPSFFFISFFYFYPIIKERNSFKMKSRLERLFIPFIIWPTFIWVFNNLFHLFFKTSLYGRKLTFKELLIQLIIGRKFFGHFWYLFNLILLSIVFFIFSFLRDYIFLIFMNLVQIMCFILQHNKYIYIFFADYHGCVTYSVGHFISSFPIAISALTFNKSNIIQYLEIHMYKSLFIIFSILPIIFIYGLPNTYEGVDKILFSCFAFFGFHLLPFNKYLHRYMKNIIYIITNFTNGIYCLHTMIYLFLKIEFKCCFSLYHCILIYIICYIISFLGAKVFVHNKMKYLFF